MKLTFIETREMHSPRWGRLCEALGLGSPGERWQAFGHLVGWYMHWGSEPELEAGVWWDVSMTTLGSWAEVGGDAGKWGRALHVAGYVRTLKQRYGEPLGTWRTGWVAVQQDGSAILDLNIGYLRRRFEFPELVLYVTGRERRVKWAALAGLDVKALVACGRIAPGWLDGEAAPEPAAATCSVPTGRFDAGGAVAAEEEADERCTAGTTSAPAAAPRRVVRGFAAAVARSGTPKSPELLAQIRGYKYADPLRALCLLDSSERAQYCWRQAVGRDVARVRQELGELVETDERWALLRNPAAVVMTNFKKLGLVQAKN